MSIDQFLNDFENQGSRAMRDKKFAENARLKEQGEDAEYLERFRLFYIEKLIPQFNEMKQDLVGKFNLYYNEPTIAQRNNYFANVTIIPSFSHTNKEIIIRFTAEGTRKLISISGNAKDAKGVEIGDDVFIFQDTIEAFEQLNIQDQISEILNKLFIRK